MASEDGVGGGYGGLFRELYRINAERTLLQVLDISSLKREILLSTVPRDKSNVTVKDHGDYRSLHVERKIKLMNDDTICSRNVPM